MPTTVTRRGRPPILAKIVEHIEATGNIALADQVRVIAHLPPRTPTANEEFVATVLAQCTRGGVGFQCASDEQVVERQVLVAALVAPAGRRYVTQVDGLRLEVKLIADG